MATVFYIGAVQPLPAVRKITITTAVNGYAYTLARNGRVATYTATAADTVDTISAGLMAAAQNSAAGELSSLSYQQDATTPAIFYVTGKANGEPTTLTIAGANMTQSSTQAEQGPHDASAVGNYSTGALPAGTDTLIFQAGAGGPKFNLSALNAIALAAVVVYDTFPPEFGNPDENPGGYAEFLPKYLKLNCVDITVYVSQAAGAQAYRIEVTSASPSAFKAIGPANSPAGTGVYPVDVYGQTSTSSVTAVATGITIAAASGQANTAAAVTLTDATGKTGSGLALADLAYTNSTVEMYGGYNTLTQFGGTTTVFGTGGVGGSNVATRVGGGGSLDWRSSGSLGDGVELAGGSTFSASLAPAAVAVSYFEAGAGATINNTADRLTRPFEIRPQACAPQDVNYNGPSGTVIEAM